jgi:hypothetical protein
MDNELTVASPSNLDHPRTWLSPADKKQIESLARSVSSLRGMDPEILKEMPSRQSMESAVKMLSASLTSSTSAEIAVEFSKLIQMFRCENLEEVAPLYVEALAEIPPDLLKLATVRLLKSHKYPILPKPADFFEAIRPEVKSRQRDLQIISTALWKQAYLERKSADQAASGSPESVVSLPSYRIQRVPGSSPRAPDKSD